MAAKVLKFNGSTWTESFNVSNPTTAYGPLMVYNGKLYVGSSTTASPHNSFIYAFDETAWVESLENTNGSALYVLGIT